MKSLVILRKAIAPSIHCFMPSRNCGERMYSSQDWARAWKMPPRIWRRISGGGESGLKVKAACMILAIDSIQSFWKAAACSADFWKRSSLIVSAELDGQGDGLAAADAQRVDAGAGATLFHRVDESHQRARAAGADGVAQGDSATLNIDLVVGDTEFFHGGHRHDREGLVDLVEIHVLSLP